MGAVRIGAVGAGDRRAGIELRWIDGRTLREVSKADRAVGTGDANDAVADLEIAGAGLERLSGNLAQVRAELMRGALDADAAGGNRGRAAGAQPGRDLIAVRLVNVHALGKEPELLGDDLRIGGVMALPGRLAADQDGDVAVGVEPDISGLLRAHRAADFQ